MYNFIQRIKRALGYGGAGAAIALAVATGLNPAALTLVKDFEGLELEAYLDPVGIPTIGYGQTNLAGTVTFSMGDAWTEEYAEEVLIENLQIFWDHVDAAIIPELTNCQMSVLTSWTYNVGPTAMRNSTLVRHLNAGIDDVPTQLMRWNKAGGRVLRGLTRRRAAEAELWVTNCGEL